MGVAAGRGHRARLQHASRPTAYRPLATGRHNRPQHRPHRRLLPAPAVRPAASGPAAAREPEPPPKAFCAEQAECKGRGRGRVQSRIALALAWRCSRLASTVPQFHTRSRHIRHTAYSIQRLAASSQRAARAVAHVCTHTRGAARGAADARTRRCGIDAGGARRERNRTDTRTLAHSLLAARCVADSDSAKELKRAHVVHVHTTPYDTYPRHAARTQQHAASRSTQRMTHETAHVCRRHVRYRRHRHRHHGQNKNESRTSLSADGR